MTSPTQPLKHPWNTLNFKFDPPWRKNLGLNATHTKILTRPKFEETYTNFSYPWNFWIPYFKFWELFCEIFVRILKCIESSSWARVEQVRDRKTKFHLTADTVQIAYYAAEKSCGNPLIISTTSYQVQFMMWKSFLSSDSATSLSIRSRSKRSIQYPPFHRSRYTLLGPKLLLVMGCMKLGN